MMDSLYTLSPKALWSQFKKEHFAYWMACFYLVLQYVDPLKIYPSLDFLPWDKVAIGLAVLALPTDPRRRWVRDATNVWMTLFGIVIIAASTLAIYPSISWTYWFDFFNWFVIYFLIINVVTTSERYFIFLLIFLVANFKLSFYGGRTWVLRGFGFTSWGLKGPPGDFQNSADFSTEMLMFAPIAFELAMFLKPHVRKVFYWFLMSGAVTGAMSVLGASSRGAQVAMAAQTVWIAIQRKLKLKVLIAIALAAGIGYALLPTAEKTRLMNSGNDQTSIQRLEYWKAGLKMIENHPVLGVGYFNFRAIYAERDSNKLFYGKAQLPHNIFIQVGTDAGLVGLGIFLILIYRNLKLTKIIRQECQENENAPRFARGVARGLAVATWGFVIAGQFNTVAYYPFLWINLALTVSLCNIVKQSTKESGLSNLPQRSVNPHMNLTVPSGWSPGELPAARDNP